MTKSNPNCCTTEEPTTTTTEEPTSTTTSSTTSSTTSTTTTTSSTTTTSTTTTEDPEDICNCLPEEWDQLVYLCNNAAVWGTVHFVRSGNSYSFSGSCGSDTVSGSYHCEDGVMYTDSGSFSCRTIESLAPTATVSCDPPSILSEVLFSDDDSECYCCHNCEEWGCNFWWEVEYQRWTNGSTCGGCPCENIREDEIPDPPDVSKIWFYFGGCYNGSIATLEFTGPY